MDNKSDTGCIDVRYVADLARLELTDDEALRYGAELSAILAYVAQLNELNLDGIEPTAHATRLVNVFRADVAGSNLDRKLALANAPALTDDVLIRVPQVIEEEEA